MLKLDFVIAQRTALSEEKGLKPLSGQMSVVVDSSSLGMTKVRRGDKDPSFLGVTEKEK